MAPEMEIARALTDAVHERRAIEPFTDADPTLDVEAAYRIQEMVVGARLAAGATRIGAKLGLTSRAKQLRMNVDQPLYGWLTSDMLLDGGEPVSAAGLIQPRAEPEIAFLLGEPLRAPATVASVLAATRAVMGAVEIIDSRYDSFRFRLPDVVADNASSAGVILGPVALSPSEVGDLRLAGCVLRAGGEVAATAAGAAVLGHPAAAVAWLVNQLDRRRGSLPAGSIVLSGALTDALPIGPGAVVSAEFDRLGCIEVRG